MARFIKRWLVCGAVLIGAVSARADDASRLLNAPKLPPYKWFASTDPKGQNLDYILLKPGETRRIPLASGVLLRLWSTAFEPENITLVLQNGNQKTELLSGGKAKFGELYEKAFTWYPRSNPADCMLTGPLELKNGVVLIATNHSKKENKWYYQASVRPIVKPESAVKKLSSFKLPGKKYHKNAAEKNDALGQDWFTQQSQITLKASAEQTIWETKNAGCITSIGLRRDAGESQKISDLHLRITYDDASSPPIDFALKDFYHSSMGGFPFSTPVMGITEGDFLTRLEIPFAKGARISLYNPHFLPMEITSYVTAIPWISPYRLHVKSGSARSQKGKPIPILKVQGEGAFVGLVLDIRPAPEAMRRTFAFLEGNETLTADGNRYEGTGAEDFFNSAWYYPEKPFAGKYHGMSFKSTLPPRVTAYRWMIPDAVPFQKSFQFDFEHGNGNNSNNLEYRWVAFWYQKQNAKFEIKNALPDTPTAEARSTPAGFEESTTEESQSNENKSAAILAALAGAAVVLVLLAARFKTRKPS